RQWGAMRDLSHATAPARRTLQQQQQQQQLQQQFDTRREEELWEPRSQTA
ncbi:hypothetical protein ETH_00035525, partial [Eimeria tenella]